MLKMDKCWWRGMLLLAGLLLLVPMRGLAIQTTNVQGIVYRADGSLAQGTMLVSWPAFTAADGSTVAAGNTTVTIAPDGSVSMALAPNVGANPQGTYYTVVYHMNDGTVQKEYWVVPQAATATISADAGEGGASGGGTAIGDAAVCRSRRSARCRGVICS